MKKPSFRLGTTSYIIPDDILPNARFLAGKVRDIELVLFEVEDDNGQEQGNLPTPETLQELKTIAARHALTYTIHLPLDLRLGAEGAAQHISMRKARKVIECTRTLDPWAYVLHLDGREERLAQDSGVLARWQAQAAAALTMAGEWAGGAEKLAVENLDSYPLEFNQPVLERVPACECVDIGHLWLDGHDPLAYLEKHLPRTRVIHLHGIGARDHQSVSLAPPEKLDAVLHFLIKRAYRGVVTLEVFNEADLNTSISAVEASLSRSGGQ
jgi:sugar phosphate isomerase/epimerase